MKKALLTQDAPAAIGPYSQGVRAGDFLYVSGQLPLNPYTKKMGDTIGEQTARSLINIEAILKTEGATLADVVKTTVFLKNMADFKGMNEVYMQHFSANDTFPARAAVEVSALPVDGALVEIEAVAWLGK